MARTKEKWQSSFLIAKQSYQSLAELETQGGLKLLVEACTSYRNPLIFDNNVVEASFKLPFYIPGVDNEDMTHDHLIGMSNSVLYIYKKGLFKNWQSPSDFIDTLKAFQVLLWIPKSLNDKGTYKSWKFDYSNIENCIFWNEKLKREGILTLTAENGKFESSVDEVWQEWYEQYNKFLCFK